MHPCISQPSSFLVQRACPRIEGNHSVFANEGANYKDAFKAFFISGKKESILTLIENYL